VPVGLAVPVPVPVLVSVPLGGSLAGLVEGDWSAGWGGSVPVGVDVGVVSAFGVVVSAVGQTMVTSCSTVCPDDSVTSYVRPRAPTTDVPRGAPEIR
jgi:hypothetical protein